MGSDKKRRADHESEPGSAKKEKKSKKSKAEPESADATPSKKSKHAKADDGEKQIALDSSNAYLSPISSPMADPKLVKKVLKLVAQAAKEKELKRGIKEVAKAIRKGIAGLCIIAGDIYPLDVISHVPIALEEAHIPYCYVPQKVDLGAAALTKRPTSIVLVPQSKSAAYKDDLAACSESVSKLPVLHRL